MDLLSNVREASLAGVQKLAPQRPLRSSKSLRLAAVAMLLGAVMWFFRTEKPTGLESATGAHPPSSEVERSSNHPDQTTKAKSHRLVPTSPALFRLGAGFLGGFAIGFACRRFLKVAAWAVGIALAVIAIMKLTGWFGLDWSAIESHVRESLAWTTSGVEWLKTLLTGYLPSALAGFLGVFKGLRWR
jgi:uncharacterized membrane protein (Fun14 family)